MNNNINTESSERSNSIKSFARQMGFSFTKKKKSVTNAKICDEKSLLVREENVIEGSFCYLNISIGDIYVNKQDPLLNLRKTFMLINSADIITDSFVLKKSDVNVIKHLTNAHLKKVLDQYELKIEGTQHYILIYNKKGLVETRDYLFLLWFAKQLVDFVPLMQKRCYILANSN